MQHRSLKFLSSFFTLGLALALTACQLVPPPTTPQSTAVTATVISTPVPAEISPNGVIFSAEQSAQARGIFTAESTWTPSPADVAKLEAGLTTFLQGVENPWLRTDPPIWQRVPEYHRQYLGLVQNGEDIIYANFFCVDDFDDWQNEFVLVMDGGDCFFQIRYNPQTDEFLDIMINGEA